MAEEGYRVALNVYDLSWGLARQLSTTFLGKAIEAIWHTGVVVYGIEYCFGAGIQQAPAGTTPYGIPIRVVDLGVTHIPKEVFEDYLQDIGPRYTAETYRLLSHNCNNFSNEVAQFLVGNTIPDYILNLPNEVINSPMGPLILPMIQQLEATLRAGAVPQASQFRPSVSLPPRSESTTPGSSPSTLVNSGSSVSSVVEHGNGDAPAVEPANKLREEQAPAADPLGDARNKVQEEIMREFSAIMATGSLRASEAAALATRKVMERYGRLNVTTQQG